MDILRGFGFFITTNLIYLAISLIGWGLNDLRGFFSIPQRFTYAIIVEVLRIAVGIQAVRSPESIRGGKGRDDMRVPRQRIIRNIVILLMYFTLWFLPFADRRGIGAITLLSTFRWIGILFFGVGMWFVYWSGIRLGKLYSGDVTLQENHHLVIDVPYTHIRHHVILAVYSSHLVFLSFIIRGLVMQPVWSSLGSSWCVSVTKKNSWQKHLVKNGRTTANEPDV